MVKEIGDVDLILKGVVVDDVAVLVYKRERRDCMVDGVGAVEFTFAENREAGFLLFSKR